MKQKIRINLTIDKNLLVKARKKLNLFGGKLSTLFNVLLKDFVKSSEKLPGAKHDELILRVRELERKIKELEKSK